MTKDNGLTYTAGIDTYINPGNKVNTIAVAKESRIKFFIEHSYIHALLRREQNNPLLEEGNIFTNRYGLMLRDRQGEFHLTYESLILLVEATIKRYKNKKTHNTKNIFILKNDELAMNRLLASLDFSDESDAKIIYINGIHAVAIYLRTVNDQVNALIVDSKLTDEAKPTQILKMLRAVFSGGLIYYTTILLQNDFFSSSVFAYKALRYFVKQGQKIFTDMVRIASAIDASTYIIKPANTPPILLKMCQSQIGLELASLNTIVSKRRGETLAQYWDSHQFVMPNGESTNSAAIDTRYKCFRLLDRYIQARLGSSVITINTDANLMLPAPLNYLHRNYQIVRQPALANRSNENKQVIMNLSQHNSVPLFLEWERRKKQLCESFKINDKVWEDYLGEPAINEIILKLKIPSSHFSYTEYKMLLAFVYSGIHVQIKSNKERAIKKTQIYTAKLICAFGTAREAYAYLTRFYNRYHDACPQFMHDACLFRLPETDQWHADIWTKIISTSKPNNSEDLVFNMLKLADKIESYAAKNNISLTSLNYTAVKEVIKYVSYTRATENELAAELFARFAISERKFNKYLGLIPVNNDDLIPPLTVQGADIAAAYKGYYVTRLDSADPRAPVLGELTSCCQSIHSDARTSTIYGITQANSGFYVLCKLKGEAPSTNDKILAQAWVWHNQNVLMFDSIESQIDFRRHHEVLITDMFVYLANRLIQTEFIDCVMVGAGDCNTPQILANIIPSHLTPLPTKERLHSDAAKIQYIIAEMFLPLVSVYLSKQSDSKIKETDFPCKISSWQQIYTWLGYCCRNYLDEVVLKILPYITIPGISEKILLEKYQLIKQWQAIYTATENEIDLEKVANYLDQAPELIDHFNQNGFAIFHAAIMDQDLTATKFLVARGANRLLLCSDGKNALHLAAKFGSVPLTQFLLELKLDPNHKDNSGETPYDIAHNKLHWPLIEFYLKSDYLTIDTRSKRMDLSHYLNYKQHHLMMLLLNQLTNIDTADKNGYTPLLLAIAHRLDLEFIEKLILAGANVNARTNTNLTPLRYATMCGNLPLILLLIQHGANVKEESITLLQEASHANHWEVIKFYVNFGYDINAFTADGEHALKGFNVHATVEQLSWLIENGLDISNENVMHSLLNFPCHNINWVAVDYLLSTSINANNEFQLKSRILSDAIYANKTDTLNLLFASKIDVHYISQIECPLSFAFKFSTNKWEIIQKILSIDNDVARSGYTILSFATECLDHHIQIDTFKQIFPRLIPLPATDDLMKDFVAVIVGKYKRWDILKWLIDTSLVNENPYITELLFFATEQNHQAYIEYFMPKLFTLNITDHSNLTPLAHAAVNKHWALCELFIKHGADVNILIDQQQLFLLYLVQKGQLALVRLILHAISDINQYDNNGLRAIHYAYAGYHWEIADLLIKCGAKLYLDTDETRTLLHILATSDYASLARVLYKQGVDLNRCDCDGKLPVWHAIENKNADMWTWMLAKSNIQITTNNGETLLHLAAKLDNLLAVEQLIERGVNVDLKDKKDYTALEYAIENEHIMIVSYLIKNGSKLPQSAKTVSSLRSLALRYANRDILVYLLRSDIDIYADTIDASRSYNRIANEDLSFFRWYLELDVKLLKPHVRKILSQTIINNNIGRLELLLPYIQDINEKSCSQETALEEAARYYSSDWKKMVDWLITHGASIHFKSPNGGTFLHYAARANNIKYVKMALESGIDVNTLDVDGNTALFFVTKYNYIKKGTAVIDLLLAAGATVKKYKDQTRTIFNYAIKSNHLSLFKLCVDKGVALIPTRKSISLLELAMENKSWDIVKHLIQLGAELNSKALYDNVRYENCTPVQYLYNKQQLALMHLAIQNGADINQTSSLNHTLIYFAAREKNWDIVEYLLDLNATVDNDAISYILNCKDDSRLCYLLKRLVETNRLALTTHKSALITCLTNAVYKAKWQTLSYLLDLGISPNTPNIISSGIPLILVVADQHKWDIVIKFIQKGARLDATDYKRESLLSRISKDKAIEAYQVYKQYCKLSDPRKDMLPSANPNTMFNNPAQCDADDISLLQAPSEPKST